MRFHRTLGFVLVLLVLTAWGCAEQTATPQPSPPAPTGAVAAPAERAEPPRAEPRPPTHPGEMLLEELLKPLGVTQSELALRLGVSFPRLKALLERRLGRRVDLVLRDALKPRLRQSVP